MHMGDAARLAGWENTLHAHGGCCKTIMLESISAAKHMLQSIFAAKHMLEDICAEKAHVHACCIRNAHVLQQAWLWYKGLVTQMNALCAFTYVSTGVSYTSIGHRNQKFLRISSSSAQTADHNSVRIMSNTYTRMTDVCQNYVKLLTHF